MIFNLFFSFLIAAPICNQTAKNHPEFIKVEQEIEKIVRKSANLVTIASQADSVLSKLISQKSPVLMKWLEKRKLLSKKEEVIAGEWRYYYLNEFILAKYPTPNPQVNASVEKIFSDVNSLTFPENEKKRIEDIFKKSQGQAVKVINSMAISNDAKKEILTKIKEVRLYWFEKLKKSRYQNKPLEFLKWGVAYDPMNNEINIGVYVRKYPDEHSLFAVFAHEIGHVFDPCRWQAFFKTKNPFTKLYQCLRSPQSTGALARNDSKMQWMLDKKLLNQAMADSLKKNSYCNRSFYPPVGTQKEQLLEVFADWFSAEVIAQTKPIPENIRQDLCQKSELSKGSSYLANQDRLTKIYAVQPEIKKALNIKTNQKYCELLKL